MSQLLNYHGSWDLAPRDGVTLRFDANVASTAGERAKDHLWLEWLAMLRDWSVNPESIPLEEGDQPISQPVAHNAFEVAKSLYEDGLSAPTIIVPSCDGSIVFERQVGDMAPSSRSWEHWSLRVLPSGEIEISELVANRRD